MESAKKLSLIKSLFSLFHNKIFLIDLMRFINRAVLLMTALLFHINQRGPLYITFKNISLPQLEEVWDSDGLKKLLAIFFWLNRCGKFSKILENIQNSLFPNFGSKRFTYWHRAVEKVWSFRLCEPIQWKLV